MVIVEMNLVRQRVVEAWRCWFPVYDESYYEKIELSLSDRIWAFIMKMLALLMCLFFFFATVVFEAEAMGWPSKIFMTAVCLLAFGNLACHIV